MKTVVRRRPRSAGAARPARDPRALSPLVAFPAVWVLAVAVSQVQLLNVQRPWSAAMWIVVFLVPVAFVLGGVLAATAARRHSHPSPPTVALPPHRRMLRVALVACVVLGYLELAHQFALAGGIPLLSANIDTTRLAQPGGPTILLTDLLTVAAVVGLSTPRDLLTRGSRLELALAVAALAGFAMQGGRGSIALPLVVALFVRSLRWGLPRPRSLAAGAVVVAGAIIALFYLRAGQQATNPFKTELYSEVLPSLPGLLHPLVPLHVALATNFEALARIVEYFPAAEAFGHGRFTAQGLDLVVPGARPLGTISALLTPPWVTSTVAGTLWADGGMPIVAVGSALTGAISTGAYALARRTGELRHALVAGYLLYYALFGVYTNLWATNADWLLVVPLLFAVGTLAEGRVAVERLPRLGRYARRPGARRSWRRSVRVITAAKRLRTASAGKPVLGALAALVVLVVLATAIQTLLPDSDPPKPVGLTVSATAPFPTGMAPATVGALVTDGDLHGDNEPVWQLPVGSGRALLHEYAFAKPDLLDRLRRRLRIPPAERGNIVDVARWDSEGPTDVFSLRRTKGGRTVTARSTAGELRATGVAPLGAPRRGFERDVAVATFSGPRPDLFVIDRGPRQERAELTVYSGESAYRQKALKVKLPLRGLLPPKWSVDVGVVEGSKPDLVLVTRRGLSGRPEAHVLSGESRFQAAVSQQPLDATVARLRAGFAIGSSLGRPTLYLVSLSGHPSIRLVPLGPATSRP